MIVAKNRFREHRLRSLMSMRDLSDASGVALNAICRIEHGRPVRPRTARKLCVALNAEFDDLFEIREG